MFYNSLENKVFILINSIFLKHDYMNNNKPQSKVLLEELESHRIRQPQTVNVDTLPN